MKMLSAIVCLALAATFIAEAEEEIPGWTTPEARRSLECTINSSSNYVAVGSRIPVVLTLRNIGPTDIELPDPFGGEINMEIRFYLLNAQTRSPALNSPIQSSWNSGEREGFQKPQRWIKLSPNEKKEIPLFVDIPSTNSESESISPLSPGSYGLKCEIEYHMGKVISGCVRVGPYTTPADIAEYKVKGYFLVYMGQLWAGKTESNILPFILTTGPK